MKTTRTRNQQALQITSVIRLSWWPWCHWTITWLNKESGSWHEDSKLPNHEVATLDVRSEIFLEAAKSLPLLDTTSQQLSLLPNCSKSIIDAQLYGTPYFYETKSSYTAWMLMRLDPAGWKTTTGHIKSLGKPKAEAIVRNTFKLRWILNAKKRRLHFTTITANNRLLLWPRVLLPTN